MITCQDYPNPYEISDLKIQYIESYHKHKYLLNTNKHTLYSKTRMQFPFYFDITYGSVSNLNKFYIVTLRINFQSDISFNITSV